MIDRQLWVYDIETLASCFTYTAYNVDTQEVVQYVIHKNRNDLLQLINHLKACKGHIGFNNLSFDYPIIHYLLLRYDILLDDILNFRNQEIVTYIYEKSQEIINTLNSGGYTAIKPKECYIPQLDLFRIWHYNNKARMTSLKALEISMNYPNVMDMPIDHAKKDITLEDIPMILNYNLNDVMATYEFYLKSIDKINLRKQIQQQFNIPCLNWSDSKIGEQLILKLFCDKTGQSIWDVKDMRSERLKIALNDIILEKITFESEEFNGLLSYVKGLEIIGTKDSFKKSVVYKGFKYDYGTGGIHGCIKPGIYLSDSQYMIIDADVASLYPNLAITNNFYPEHLGDTFNTVYKSIIDMRMEAKGKGNMVLSDGFKLAANSVYGKSNDKHSFLYDPQFTMAITINGQLLLTMLAERLLTRLNDITVLQINTDGITVRIHRNNFAKYMNECHRWEDLSGLKLEFVDYDKMIIGDVNNYLAVTTTGKVKNKGRYEVNKVVGSEPAYHKDNSFKIVPLALQEYFVNGKSIEKTVREHTDIYDFCGRQKFKGHDYGMISHISGDSIVNHKMQKNVRYYISNKGSVFTKYYAKGTTELINKGYLVTIFNEFVKKGIGEYNINYDFYIKECYKEIDNIINKQLSLFE